MSGDYGPHGEQPYSKGITHTGGYDSPAEREAQRPNEQPTDADRRDTPPSGLTESPHRSFYVHSRTASVAPSFDVMHFAPVLLFLALGYGTYATVRSMHAVLTPATASDGEMLMMASPASLVGLIAGPAYALVYLHWFARSGAPLWEWLKLTLKRLTILVAFLFIAWVVWRNYWTPTFNTWLDGYMARMSSSPTHDSATKRQRRARRSLRATATPAVPQGSDVSARD